jgi:hypothetical protein
VRRASAWAAVVLFVATCTVWLGSGTADARVKTGDVTMTVDDVSPNSPAVTTTPKPLVFTLTLINNTADTLKDVVVSADRSDPIGTQRQLDLALARPKPPSEQLVAPVDTTVTATLLPHATRTVKLRTTTSTTPDQPGTRAGVCLCANAVYPFWFTARYTSSADGVVTDLATAQTYVPAFNTAPAKTTVSWVWPLLDRPHRLLYSKVFTDDTLTQEVGPGGRLDKLLQVVESVAPSVPLTIVTDPDLIDELATMTTGYRVTSPSGGTVAGTGGDAAQAWLARLRAVLAAHPQIELAFTPFADPAVDALTRAGMRWSVSLDAQAQQRVSTAVGRDVVSDIAWPAGLALSGPTLESLVSQGANTVLLSDHGLTAGGAGADPVPDALATLSTRAGNATVAVTSTPIERSVRAVLDPNGPGLRLLPKLVAQLSVRVVTSLDTPHYVVITPPRDLDVDPTVAARTIEATSVSTWSTPMALRAAVRTTAPVDHGVLRQNQPAPRLSRATIASLTYLEQSLPTVQSLIADDTVRTVLFSGYPVAIQRCESSSLLNDRAHAAQLATQLAGRVAAMRRGVSIVPPSNGTYTLTSKSSQLPVTVVNKINTDIRVRVAVEAVADVPGITAGDQERDFLVKANSKTQLRIPTHVDRVGLIEVRVELTTPDGLPVGKPVRLAVRSTALGTIGVVITIVAAIVLALAVLVRFARRLRQRGRRQPSSAPRPPAGPGAPGAPAGSAAARTVTPR